MIFPYTKNHQIYQCPSDTGVRDPGTWPPTACVRWSSYAYNRFDAGNGTDAPFRTDGRVKLSAMDRPAELVMVLDNGERDTGFERAGQLARDDVCGQGFRAGICDLPIDEAVPAAFGGTSSCSVSYHQHYRRHSEGLNSGFFDGHVKWLRHGSMKMCPLFRMTNVQ